MATAVTWKHVCASFIAMSALVQIVWYLAVRITAPSPHYIEHQECAWTKPKIKTSPTNDTPPWLLLLANYNATVSSGRNLYAWPCYAYRYRLGNKLFNYAALFGIAWHNRRIPIWPQNRASVIHDITKYFNLRIHTDQHNAIMRVSLLSY